MGPVRQYAMEPSEEPLTLRVYPGADGRCSWYEDDGISFAYRKGQLTRIECTWQDGARRLTLAPAEGNMPTHQRAVRIQAMDTGATKTVSLPNRTVVVEL
jgi:alpha-glucosidase (family GH31 glycosyl hydrolase)